MNVGILNKKDREASNLVPRFRGSRKDRYVEISSNEKATMVGVLKDLLTYGTSGKLLSDSTNKFIKESVMKAKELGWSDGLIATYKGEYVIVFLKVEGLDHSALKITHNEDERRLFNEFFVSSAETDRFVFQLMCLNLLREKQRIALLNGRPTYGTIYSNYPEEDEYIETFVRYVNINKASKIVNVNGIHAVNAALERGCSIEEIMSVLPRGTENKFFNTVWTDYELAQMNALEPGISARA